MPKVAVKATVTPKVAVKATVTPKVSVKATPKVAVTATPKVAVKATVTADTGNATTTTKPLPADWNAGKSGQKYFAKAWNYHNDIASKRQIWTKEALTCLKEYSKFKGASWCSVCDPDNEKIYDEMLHIHLDSAKPMLKACATWAQSFKYLNEMAQLTFAYSTYLAGWKMGIDERAYMLKPTIIDISECESSNKITKSLVTPKADKKRVLQQVVAPTTTPATKPTASTGDVAVTVNSWKAWVTAPFKPYQEKEIVINEKCADNLFLKRFINDWLMRDSPVVLNALFKHNWVGYRSSVTAGGNTHANEAFVKFAGTDFLPVKINEMNRVLQQVAPAPTAAPINPKEEFPPTWKIDNKGLILDKYKNFGLPVPTELTALDTQSDILASGLMKVSWILFGLLFAVFAN